MERRQDLGRLATISEDEHSDGLEVLEITSWEELETRMREVALQGDPSILPYAEASIESRRVKISETYPLSLYALEGQIYLHQKMRRLFLEKCGLDIYNLSGIVRFKIGGREFRLAPPVLEVSAVDGNKQLLVDGIHRFLVAKSNGEEAVRAVVVSNVPGHLPLVPLPLGWDDIKIYGQVPPETEKRRFRYPTIESFPDISGFSQVRVTQQNCRYFFYRDLSPLGSSGMRKEKDSK